MTIGWNRCRGQCQALTSGKFNRDETWTCNICGRTQPLLDAHGGNDDDRGEGR